MTTPHVLDQLPLWVEGDLSSRDHAEVQAHLALCSSCRAEADRLRTSQAWLREALDSPFEAADRDQFRRRVMDQIRSEPVRSPHRRLLPRPVLLAAGAAALMIITLVWHQARPGAVSPPEAEAPTAATLPQAKAATEGPPRQALGDPTRAAPRVARYHPVAEANPPRHEAAARIEFQTADPTIRIIWLAQAKPFSEAIPPFQEAP